MSQLVISSGFLVLVAVAGRSILHDLVRPISARN